MAEKKDSIRTLIDTGRRIGKLTSSEISDAMEENGNVLDVEAMEKLYEELESNGIEIVDDTPVEVDDTVSGADDGADDYEDGLTADGITIDVPNPNTIIISGPDKQKVGQFAAEVREKRPPEPYKGKGIRYADEFVRRKEGKTGAKKK